jgi:hypothetical protein
MALPSLRSVTSKPAVTVPVGIVAGVAAFMLGMTVAGGGPATNVASVTGPTHQVCVGDIPSLGTPAPMTCSVVVDAPTPTPTDPSTPVSTTTPPVTTSPTVGPTTPPPSPSPTTTPPTQTVNCILSPHLCGFPDATNTGVPPNWVPIRNQTGGLNVSTPGSIIDGWNITGCVTIRAANVIIRNSKIVANGCTYAVHNFSTGLQIRNSTISCGGFNGNGVSDNELSLIASDVSGCENGMNVASINGSLGNVTVQDSYIHGLVNTNSAHTDGIQIGQGAAHLRFTHNTIINPFDQTSAIIMWDEGNPQNTDVIISGNILDGGDFSLYCPRMNTTGVIVTNNRIGTGWAYAWTNGCTPGHVQTFSGNVNDKDNKALQAA